LVEKFKSYNFGIMIQYESWLIHNDFRLSTYELRITSYDLLDLQFTTWEFFITELKYSIKCSEFRIDVHVLFSTGSNRL